MRTFSAQDYVWMAAQDVLAVFWGQPRGTGRPSPGEGIRSTLSPQEQRKSAQMLRVDHVGEVCAQGLYQGQAWVAKDPNTAAYFKEAAAEECDHLRWCAQRLTELDSRPSYLNPLWYAGSFAIGAFAGHFGDTWNLGFMWETEQQVAAHLAGQLEVLAEGDHTSRAILWQMKIDEGEHAHMAYTAGGSPLPMPVRVGMYCCAQVMIRISTYI